MTKVSMTVTDEILVELREKLQKAKEADDPLFVYDFVAQVFGLQKKIEKERESAKERRKKLLIMKKDYLEAYDDFMRGMEKMKQAREKYSEEDDAIGLLTNTADARKEDLDILSPFVDMAFYYMKKIAGRRVLLSVPRDSDDGTRYSEYELDVGAKPVFQTAHGHSKEVLREQLELGVGGGAPLAATDHGVESRKDGVTEKKLKKAVNVFQKNMQGIVNDKNSGVDKITVGIPGEKEVVVAENPIRDRNGVEVSTAGKEVNYHQ